ncbi:MULTISPECIES: replication endonuclease [Methylobacter]
MSTAQAIRDDLNARSSARPMTKAKAKKLAIKHLLAIEQTYIFSKTLVYFYLQCQGIEPPKASNDDSFFLRVLCVDWWIRQLLRKDARDREATSILAGNVAKGRQIYCSDATVINVQERWANTLQGMEQKLCVSDAGDELDMLDILKSSLANPENRRAELMVRMSGFEQYADSNDHVGMFYTITCPSKYHRFMGKSLQKNTKYNGATPKDAQKYLVGVWSRIRAELDSWGVKPYGFRVSEPHHDGTPHWHILLFMPRDYEYLITETIQEYACKEDSYELASPGAMDSRFNAKRILKEIITKDGVKKVSATGYIAKYIAKNIGFDIGMDSEDATQSTDKVSDRVRAWASTWGIRQFQQLGGASVSVWRELRRLKDKEIEHDVIREARDCCINNDWAGFLVVMGGTEIKRVERELQLLKKNEFNEETGEMKINRYQEIVWKIVGITADVFDVVTHFKKWAIIQKPQDIRASGGGRFSASPPL